MVLRRQRKARRLLKDCRAADYHLAIAAPSKGCLLGGFLNVLERAGRGV